MSSRIQEFELKVDPQLSGLELFQACYPRVKQPSANMLEYIELVDRVRLERYELTRKVALVHAGRSSEPRTHDEMKKIRQEAGITEAIPGDILRLLAQHAKRLKGDAGSNWGHDVFADIDHPVGEFEKTIHGKRPVFVSIKFREFFVANHGFKTAPILAEEDSYMGGWHAVDGLDWMSYPNGDWRGNSGILGTRR